MRKVLTVMAVAGTLALAGCSTAPPAAAPPSSAPPTVSQAAPVTPAGTPAPAPSVEPSADPLAALTVDVTQSQVFTFDDGLKITFNGATVAAPGQIGSDPVDGSDAVILAFTYENGTAETIPLQAVPLDVVYGADWYDADSPTLYDGDTTFTELPAQIAPGSTVEVINTYWIPGGEPITVTVDVSGSADQSRPVPMFKGITVK